MINRIKKMIDELRGLITMRDGDKEHEWFLEEVPRSYFRWTDVILVCDRGVFKLNLIHQPTGIELTFDLGNVVEVGKRGGLWKAINETLMSKNMKSKYAWIIYGAVERVRKHDPFHVPTNLVAHRFTMAVGALRYDFDIDQLWDLSIPVLWLAYGLKDTGYQVTIDCGNPQIKSMNSVIFNVRKGIEFSGRLSPVDEEIVRFELHQGGKMIADQAMFGTTPTQANINRINETIMELIMGGSHHGHV